MSNKDEIRKLDEEIQKLDKQISDSEKTFKRKEAQLDALLGKLIAKKEKRKFDK
jgi:uncharacterized coiled-coil protein SlyX